MKASRLEEILSNLCLSKRKIFTSQKNGSKGLPGNGLLIDLKQKIVIVLRELS